jgi:hypothetical protein
MPRTATSCTKILKICPIVFRYQGWGTRMSDSRSLRDAIAISRSILNWSQKLVELLNRGGKIRIGKENISPLGMKHTTLDAVSFSVISGVFGDCVSLSRSTKSLCDYSDSVCRAVIHHDRFKRNGSLRKVVIDPLERDRQPLFFIIRRDDD